MSLEFTVEGADGPETMTANDLASAFQSQGFQNAQLSQDGQTLTLVDANGGQAEVNIPEYLSAKGKVTGMRPVEGMVNYDLVDNGARRGIAALGNHEDLKKLYLQAHLRDQGLGDAKVVGSGDDYYFFDPKSGRYHALTNKPGLDMADVNEFGVDAVENTLGIGGAILGGIGGGTAGTAAGPVGTLLGGAAGSALGGASGRAAFDLGAMAIDPKLRDFIGSEEFQKSRLQQTAFDALGGAGGEAIGLVAPKLLSSGLVSGAAKKVGGGVEAVGDAVAGGAKYLNSDAMIPSMARSVAENFVPVTGQLQIPALAMRAGELVPAGLKAGNKFANKAYSSSFKASEEALAKEMAAENIGKFSPGLEFGPRVEGRGLGKMNMVPESLDDALAQIAEEKAQKEAAEALSRSRIPQETGFQRAMDKMATFTAEKGLVREAPPSWAEKIAAKFSRTPARTDAVKEAGVRDSIINLTENTRFARSGRGLAEAAEHASKVGRAIDKVNSGAVKGTIGAVGAAGREAALLGNTLKQAGTVAAPLENRFLLRQTLPWASEESQDAWNKMTRKPKTLSQRLGYE